jgi:murein DD-endopeptidase MepM/ murein hydrolase activator NlpD
MYRYGLDYGLDGRAHPGLDIGMPAGTPLYAPVVGTVLIAGGTPDFAFYKNGEPGVGELLIRTDAGDEVVLGHMGRIAVLPGERVAVGQFVGLSGGENGDHLHLETRVVQAGGGFLVVDPRASFLIAFLIGGVAPTETPPAAATGVRETDMVGEGATATAAADAPSQTPSIPTPSAAATTAATSQPLPVLPQSAPEEDPIAAEAASIFEPVALNRQSSNAISRPDTMSD